MAGSCQRIMPLKNSGERIERIIGVIWKIGEIRGQILKLTVN